MRNPGVPHKQQSNDKTMQPQTLSRSKRLWATLTEPWCAVDSVADRELARLLASLMVVAIPIGVIVSAAISHYLVGSDPLHDTGFQVVLISIGFWFFAYVAARSGHHRLASWLTLTIATTAIFGITFQWPTYGSLRYLVMPILFAGTVLPTQAVIGYAFAVIAITLALPMWLDDITYTNLVLDQVTYIVLGAMLTLVFNLYKQGLERQRLSLLAAERTRYQEQFQAVFNGVLLHNGEYITEANDRAVGMFGASETGLLGRRIGGLLVDRDGKPASQRLLTPGEAHVLQGVRTDGSRFPVEILCTTQLRGDRSVNIIAVRDISELQEVQAHLADKSAELARANQLTTALSKVSARLGATTDPDLVIAALGEAFKQLDLACIIFELDPQRTSLIARYTTIDGSLLRITEQLCGQALLGCKISREHFVLWDALVDQREARYTPDPVQVIIPAVPVVPRPVLERLLRRSQAKRQSPVCWLPLAVERHVLGIIALWGWNVHEENLPIFSVFAAQTAATLETAQLYVKQQQDANRLRIQHDIESGILAAKPTETIFTAAIEHMADLIPYSDYAVLVENPADRTVTVYVAGPSPRQPILQPGTSYGADARLLPAQGTAGSAESQMTTIRPLSLTSCGSPLLRALALHGARHMILAPLLYNDEVMGTLLVTHHEPGQFTSVHADIAQEIARSLAVALREGHLRTELQANMDQLVSSLGEKELLLKEVHHRVKNNLQIISSLLSLQADSINNPICGEALYESKDRVRAMALIHDKLYHSGDLARVNLAEYTEDFTSQILHTYADATRIQWKADTDTMRLGIDKAVPCGLILNELLTNALKHAFPDGRHGEICVSLQNGGAHACLTVSDNGVGMPAQTASQPPQTLGFELIRTLVRQLEGEIHVESVQGTTVSVTFPL